MSKLREDLRVGILGAAAGLFSISVALLIARIDSYYAYLSWLEKTSYYDRYDRGVEGLWWIPFLVWHIILSVVASLLVHRYLTIRVKLPFLLWQVIGISSLLGWGLTVLLAVSIECISLGNLDSFEHVANIVDVANVAKYVSAAFACNVFYGSVIAASSRQYTEQLDLD